MSLFTTHIGYAIRDLLEGREIQGERASRANPYEDEKHYVEHVEVSDASNPVIYTSDGVFKLIIVRVDSPPRQPRAPKLIEG